MKITKNIFENIDIRNLICRLNVCAPDWGETNCVYNYNKFYYFLDGDGTLIIEGDSYNPIPGELFLIPANTRHTYFHNRLKPVYKYWCHFYLKLNEGQRLVYNKDTVKCYLPGERTKLIFDKLVEKDISKNLFDVLTEKAALLELLKLFFENIDFEKALSDSSNDFVNKINEYVFNNIHTNITLNQLADIMHFHPNYFINYFKKHFSISPIDYVNSARLEIAKKILIKEPALSINEVAFEVGFNDYRYFSRIFKKRYGVSPSTYKQTINENTNTLA